MAGRGFGVTAAWSKGYGEHDDATSFPQSAVNQSYGYAEPAQDLSAIYQGYDSGGPSYQYSSGGGASAPEVAPTDLEEDYTEDGHATGKTRISPWQAAWNITNAIQGMFLVALPYAVLHGGWWGVFALIGVAYICYYTGCILVECLYDEDGRRVRGSYRQIAEECWGKKWGGQLVLGAQLTELLMTCILYVVLAGDLFEGSFPNATLEKSGWMIFSTCLLLPCAFLTDLGMVSRLSFWNTVSHIAINAIVLLYCLTRISDWAWGAVRFTFDIHTFPTVLGIVVFSYTSHIFLPGLEGSMVDRKAFKPMLKWTHVAAAAFKALFGVIGFLTFAELTQEEITNNFPSQTLKIFINMILVVKALLSYPLPYYATVQIIEHEFFSSGSAADEAKGVATKRGCYSADGALREWTLGVRILVILATLLAALTTPHFALLMGLVGNITGTCLSFIWPSLFHMRIKATLIDQRTKIKNCCIIGLGLLFGFVGVIYSSQELARAINAVDEYE